MKCLIIQVGDQKYALPIEHIVHIIDPVKLSNLHNAPHYVMGALNFHGELIWAINLAKLLKRKEEKIALINSVMVICQISNKKFVLVCSSVDSVEEVEGEIALIKGDQILLLDLNGIIDQEVLNA